MPAARLVYGEMCVVEQMDFVPSAGQIVVAPDGVRYRVLHEAPEVRHVSLGAGLPAKWMNVVKVDRADRPQKREPSVVKG